jgi:phage shock protein PspC (stress-responsive transcriptional regulator)
MIGGVCGGLAEYLNMDATLVRILTVLISLFTGVPVILYIIALFVIPEAGAAPSAPSYPPVTGAQNTPPFTTGATAPADPAYAPYPQATPTPTPQRTSADDAIWGTEGPPWEQRETQEPPATPAAEAAAPAESVAPAESATPTESAMPADPQPSAPSEPEAPVVPPGQSDEAPKS